MKKLLSSMLILGLLAGCTPQIGDVSAKEGRTESTKVEQLVIPFDPKKPKYVLVVKPFETTTRTVTFTDNEAGTIPIGDKMSAQLITALTKVGNFVLYDNKSAKKIVMPKGAKGPYYVTSTLTELTENAESESESSGGSLGGVGALTGIAGAVTGNRALGWTGFGLAVANPTYGSASAKRKGVVAFDVQITEKNTGRIVDSFDCSGTFTAESAAVGGSLFGIGKTKTVAAQSALGQALRAAMNDAAQKSFDAIVK